MEVVSIPFIAGQWSLPPPRRRRKKRRSSFNPLHCGAVVASRARTEIEAREAAFQSPSLRGSGRFHGGGGDHRAAAKVSIPFIAGQWSLHAVEEGVPPHSVSFQSPSLRGSGRFAAADVAVEFCVPLVSIPFIAGQWSLPVWRAWAAEGRAQVSIPFIAGQWSLRVAAFVELLAGAVFQSPSLRGSGRFRLRSRRVVRQRRGFQSPSLRGSGRFRLSLAWGARTSPMFQSPSLRGSGRFDGAPQPGAAAPSNRFNPLHCGAVVASRRRGRGARRVPRRVSIPFIAGQWSLQRRFLMIATERMFQSPSLRGSGRFATPRRRAHRRRSFQSPSLRGSGRFRVGLRAMGR